MPVNRFHFNENKLLEYFVTYHNHKFNWHSDLPSSVALSNALQTIQNKFLPEVTSYSSEINMGLPAWITDLGKCLQKGVIFLIDYGFPRAEYYLADRSNGTLMCHYRHRAHDNPFFWPGLQDITAHVDFTLVAEAAINSGLSIAGYTSQAGFLLGCGIIEYFQKAYDDADPIEQFNLQQQLKQLTLPNEMGEIIKVIGLSSGIEFPLCGFSMQDRRHAL
jgi:SAM-dependent MidA family methyltransferase